MPEDPYWAVPLSYGDVDDAFVEPRMLDPDDQLLSERGRRPRCDERLRLRLVAKAPLQAPGSAKLNDFADFVFEVHEESGRPIGTAARATVGRLAPPDERRVARAPREVRAQLNRMRQSSGT